MLIWAKRCTCTWLQIDDDIDDVLLGVSVNGEQLQILITNYKVGETIIISYNKKI